MRNLRYLGLLIIVFGVLALAAPAPAQIAVGVSVHVGPPALPVYTQPICPGVGYIWTPGYWAYGDDGYYWVPGTWVLAPRPGFLWTPGYWGFVGGAYGWHAGYWGPHVGFYGGINYGFGYGGVGFVGGEWRGGAFFYNRSVANINVTVIHNTYNKTVVVNNVHTSFNGEGGVNYHASAEEERYSHEEHVEATHEQAEHEHAASRDPSFRASANHGHPAVAATSKAGEFHGNGVVASRGAEHAQAAHESKASMSSHSNTEHANNASHNNASHSEAKPSHSESKPKPETQSHSQSKPQSHAESKPQSHAESKPKPSGNSKPQGEKHPHR